MIAFALLTALAPATPPKSIGVAELPDGWRAVVAARDDDQEPVEPSQDDDIPGSVVVRKRLYHAMRKATFVEREEFETLLAGGRKSVLGFKMDPKASTLAKPVLAEVTVTAQDVETYSPRPELTREDLEETFDPAAARAHTPLHETLANARRISAIMAYYAFGREDRFPKAASTAEAKANLAATDAHLRRPGNPFYRGNDPWASRNPNGGRLLFNTALSGGLRTLALGFKETPVAWDEKPWPDGSRVVAISDGSARVATAADWDRLWKSELERRKTGAGG